MRAPRDPLALAAWLVAGAAASIGVARAVLRHRAARWERGQRWGPDGVRHGCHPRSWGRGDVALVLVHGFGDSPAAWSRMGPLLAGRGFTCDAIRLPGFGESIARSGGVRREDWFRACEEALDRRRADHREVWIVAHSLGAAVALAVAAGSRPPDGLALLAPLARPSNHRSPLLPPELWFRLLRPALGLVGLLENPFPDDLRADPPPDRPASDRFFGVNLYDELLALARENDRRAGAIAADLLMVLSPDDRVADPRAASELFARAGSRRKILLRTTRSAHMIPIDHDWVEVADAIARFVRGDADPARDLAPVPPSP